MTAGQLICAQHRPHGAQRWWLNAIEGPAADLAAALQADPFVTQGSMPYSNRQATVPQLDRAYLKGHSAGSRLQEALQHFLQLRRRHVLHQAGQSGHGV